MKYGLVLAGGGARGAYQIGVWKAIKELGLEICSVSGTSIGAVNGALFVQNDFDKAYDLWKMISLEDIVSLPYDIENKNNLFDLKNLPSLIKSIRDNTGMDMQPLEELLKKVIDEEKIKHSGMEFGFTGYSLSDMKEKYFYASELEQGSLVSHLMAAVCLPGFKTRIIGGEKIMDGGMADNMPVNMLIEKGIKDIIAVDVQGIGVYKRICKYGINMINIRNDKPQVGTLEFDTRGIEDSINAGYLDTQKAFGNLSGREYSFGTAEYLEARRSLSENLLDGLETAANSFGISRYKVYTVNELVELTLDCFNDYSKNNNISDEPIKNSPAKAIIAFMVNTLRDSRKSELFKNTLSMFKNYYDAANSIMYFIK